MRQPMARVLLVLAVLLLALAAWRGPAYARGASFVIRAAQIEGVLLRAAHVGARPVAVEDAARLPTRHGPIRSRVYRPERIRRAVVLIPGVHAMGIDEPRLGHFSRELAASGIAVATIELPELMEYAFSAGAVDVIEDAVLALSERRDLARDGRIGLMGVSFAGGLSLVAAGRPSIRDRVTHVFSFGGHGDLQRALRYLCTGIEPPRPDDPPGVPLRYREPHDYGVALLLLRFAGQMVPADQVEPLSRGIHTFLHASRLDVVDKPSAGPVFEEARRMAAALPAPSGDLLTLVNERDVEALGARLLPLVNESPPPPTLSPEQSPAPEAPVYLLHGLNDRVIPSVETLLLAEHLERHTKVRYLLSQVVAHAEADREADVGEVLRLIRFWSVMLDH